MATLLLMTGLVVALFFGLVYALLFRPVNRTKSPDSPSAGRLDGRTGTRQPQSEQSPPSIVDRTIDGISISPPIFPDESAQSMHDYLMNGMALTFAGENEESETTGKPLIIEDVREDVRQLILSRIADLKNIDDFHRLQKLFSDTQATTTEISRIIMENPILSAKILRVANSPYYGMQQKLNSISHAIMIIGMVNLRALIYQESVLKALNENSSQDNQVMQDIWQHANFTSIYASYLDYLFGGLNKGTLFTLGLLHDIGKFIMMRLTPLPSGNADPVKPYSPSWTMEEEETIYGINHALVGRLAFQHWGLSGLMVDVVTLHHLPVHLPPADLNMDREALQYLLVLFLSDQAARLFAGRGREDARVDHLLKAYHELIDQKKLFHLLADKSLLSQLREAEAIAGTP